MRWCRTCDKYVHAGACVKLGHDINWDDGYYRPSWFKLGPIRKWKCRRCRIWKYPKFFESKKRYWGRVCIECRTSKEASDGRKK